MTAETSTGYAYIPIIYNITYWRGLTALSILCELGNARASYARVGERDRHLRLFLYICGAGRSNWQRHFRAEPAYPFQALQSKH